MYTYREGESLSYKSARKAVFFGRPRVLSFCESFVGACDRWMRFDGPPGSVQASGLGGTRWILALTAAWLMVLNPLLVRRGGEESQAISCASCKQTCETWKSPLSCKYSLRCNQGMYYWMYRMLTNAIKWLTSLRWCEPTCCEKLPKSCKNQGFAHPCRSALERDMPSWRLWVFFFLLPLWWLGESPAVAAGWDP